jgi:pimeloyl-ACP methyl ester carboxylesterase
MSPSTARKTAAIAAAALTLAACGGNSSGGDETAQRGEILYVPTANAVPTPNDLAFQDSEDGTLAATGNEAVNAIDGFSLVAAGKASSTVALDEDSIEAGSSVRVFEVTTAGDPNATAGGDPAGPKPVASVNGELRTDAYAAGLSPADRNNRTLAITPLRPAAPDTTYLVVLTDALEAQGGGAIAASRQYELAKRETPLVDGSGNSTVDSLNDADARQLEGVRRLVQSHLGAADGFGIAREDVIASWTFTTQQTGDSLDAVRQAVQAQTPAPAFVKANGDPGLNATGQETRSANGPSAGTVYTGALAGVPYYLQTGASDPRQVRTGAWTRVEEGEKKILTPANPKPARNATLNVPVLVALPKDDGDGPSDVVVFQHGFRADRTAMLGIANALTAQGLAVVAIDLPLHGITDRDDALYAGDAERTFNVDLVDNDGSAGPDGNIDPSGEHFLNLANLLTTRDNLRQAAADLFTVTEAVEAAAAGNVDLDNDGDADFTSNIRFLGHSLGGIVGGVFLAHEPDVGAAALGMAGGGLAKLVDASPTIGPRIEAGLEAEGLTKGTPAYEQFLGAAQTVIDSGDPVNYAELTAQGGTTATGTSIPDRNVLALEVVGGNSSPPDQVVPNDVMPPYQQGIPDDTVPSPTASTDPWLQYLGILPGGQIASSTTMAGDYVIRYTAGEHISLLSPDASPMATREMQTNVASFLASGGTQVQFAGTGTVTAP